MKLDFYVAFLLIYMQLFACSFARGSTYFIFAVIMAGVVMFEGQWFRAIGIDTILILPAQILTGALLYIGLLLMFNRTAVLGLLGGLRSKKSPVAG